MGIVAVSQVLHLKFKKTKMNAKEKNISRCRSDEFIGEKLRSEITVTLNLKENKATNLEEKSSEIPKSLSLTPIIKNDPLGGLPQTGPVKKVHQISQTESEVKMEVRSVVKTSDFLFEKALKPGGSNGSSSGGKSEEDLYTDYEYDYEYDEEDEDFYEDSSFEEEDSEEEFSNESASHSFIGKSQLEATPTKQGDGSIKSSSRFTSSHSVNSTPSFSTNKVTEAIKSNTPKFVVNKFSSFMRKMENTLEVSKNLMDAVKEVVSPLNQHELSSKIQKSLSNYQMSAMPYLNLNSLVTSNSANFGSQHSLSRKNETQHNSEADLARLAAGQSKASRANLESTLDLDPLPEDQSLKSRSIKWWGFEHDGDLVSLKPKTLETGPTLIDIYMTSCN